MSENTRPDNPVLRAIAERRSIRRYTADAVRREDALAILEAGRLAPSGKNSQPCRFLPIYAGEPEREELAKHTAHGDIVRNAQFLIAVFLDKTATYDAVKDCQAAGAAMQNMLLAAHSIGLGGLWIGQILAEEAAVLNALNLSPERFQFMALLAFGRPDDQNARAHRQPLSTFLLKSV